MILFDRRLGTASFQPCGFFGVSLINEARRWRAVIARGVKSSADRQGIAWAVSRYRAKFSDGPTDAVPNSYPKLRSAVGQCDAGPWGWPRSTVLAQVPARHPPCDGSGRLRQATRVNFKLRNAAPRWHRSVRHDAP